jgi:hypothetical protein
VSRSPTQGQTRHEAPAELRVLTCWETHAAWLLAHIGRWPRSSRFTLAGRVAEHVLDVLELLIEARYEPAVRAEQLREANLRLERMRFLLRIARTTGVQSKSGFESAMRGIDETGRMIGAWRKSTATSAGRSTGAAR